MNTTKDAALYQQLRRALAQWVDLTEPQWRKLASIFQVRTVQRQEHVLMPGAGIQELSFVCRGLLRFYCLSDDGLDSNLVFVTENRFACPRSTFSANLPLIYGIH
jgi:hypothetical protein